MDKASGKKDQETAINTKDSMQMIKNVVMGFLHGRLGTSIEGITSLINDTATGKCSGTIEVFIKEIGTRVFNMAKVVNF